MRYKSTARLFSFFIIFSILLGAAGLPGNSVKAATSITFTAEELLGKPADDSITINILPATTIEYHYQYGLSAGANTWQTDNQTATGGQPHEVTITGLSANTQYYYRMRYHLPGETDWVERTEHSFWTQRAQGSEFSFSVTSDTHAYFTTTTQNTMTNILNEHPDFEIDLGDTFMVDGKTSQAAVNTAYLAFRKPLYFDKIGSSVPIFLASGNHENEEGWNLDDSPFSIGVGSIQARKAYYPTPIDEGPGGFYSGNTDTLAAIDEAAYGDEYREDYYAWTWGDALFVVIDEFQYTMNLPFAPGAAGEGTDDAQTGDQWSWSLGAQQFQWLKQTLENSSAKYKFVFSHNMVGGIPNLTISGVGPGYVRGGAGAAPYFEWGGKNSDNTEGFAAHRSALDFGTTPLHQLMVANHVSAYFHGHDHQYVYEKTDDGIVYQEVPSPGWPSGGFTGIYSVGDHGTFETIKMLGNNGHLLVTVNPTQAKVDYISADAGTSGSSKYYYTIAPSVTHTLTTAVSPGAGGSINPAAGIHTYYEGAIADITAAPASGYTFTGWSGDCSGAGACQLSMNTDKAVTANFTLITYTLTAGNNGHGTVTLDPGGGTYVSGTTVTLTPVPNSGYVFSAWSGSNAGDITNSSGVYVIVMNGDKAVTANFSVITNPGILGDVNGDGKVNSTDALIVLSGSAGIKVTQFCPLNCGDVNGNGLVNSTDALIILSYSAGMSVPFNLGQTGCPASVTPCLGCL